MKKDLEDLKNAAYKMSNKLTNKANQCHAIINLMNEIGVLGEQNKEQKNEMNFLENHQTWNST